MALIFHYDDYYYNPVMYVNINHFMRPSAVAYSSSYFYKHSLAMHYISLLVRLCRPFRINFGSPSINIE